MTLSDINTKITDLEELLYSGVLSHAADGVTTTYRSAEDIRRELNRLKEIKRRMEGKRRRGPVFPSFRPSTEGSC